MDPKKLAAWRAHVINIATPERVSIPKADLRAIIDGLDAAVRLTVDARDEAAEWRRIAESAMGSSVVEAVAEVKGYEL